MNSYTYSLGALTLALVISGLPAVVFANESTSTLEATGTNMRVQNRLRFEFENSTTSLRSFEELRAKMETRKQELEESEASTTSEDRAVSRRYNSMRLAVHALLDSRDIIGGGIGEQVSEIARQMNDSVATTTEMEIKIHSRGFFKRLFFGGDRDAASVITQAIARNQQHIQDLIKLLDQANISEDVRATLTAQITALEDAQMRLKDLAAKEQLSWGLFSWRFGGK